MTKSSFDSLRAGAVRSGLSFVLVCVPGLVAILLLWLVFRADIQDYIPLGGDQFYYWHQILSMKEAVFQGGYYSLEEALAPAARLGIGTFGPHSIWFQIPHAIIGALFGWELWSGIVHNLVFVSAALALYAAIVRPRNVTLVFLASFMSTCLVPYQHLTTFFQEGTHYALAIIMAGLFARQQGKPSTCTKWILLATITYASMIRYDWATLFIPFYWLTTTRTGKRDSIVIALKSAGSFIFIYACYIFFRDPYTYESFPGSFSGIELYTRALRGDFSLLINHYTMNFKMFFGEYPGDPTDRLIFLNILVLYLASCVIYFTKKRAAPSAAKEFDSFASLLHSWNIGAMIFLSFTYKYSWGGGTRLLIPHFVLSVFFIAKEIRFNEAVAVLLLNILVLPMSLGSIKTANGAEYLHDASLPKVAKLLGEELRGKLLFDDKNVGWCNTLMLVGFDFDPLLIAVPPGISLSSIRVDTSNPEIFTYSKRPADKPFQARYIAVQSPTIHTIVAHLNSLRFITATPFGDIYENLDAQCSPR